MIERGVGETTFSLNRVPILLYPGLQFSIVLIQLVTGLSCGFLLGGAVGYRLPCAVAGAMLGLLLGIMSARTLGGAGLPPLGHR